MWNNENKIKRFINNINVVWGGFSVSSATINRFFSLHFTLPFILAALVVGHLLYLHISGSSNPVGTTSNADRTAFHPYFSFKDIVTVYLFFILFTVIIFYMPDKLGHSDNYIEANSMQTPPSIKIYIILSLFFFKSEIFSIFILLYLYNKLVFTSCFSFFKKFYSHLLYYKCNVINNTELDKEGWFKLIKEEEEHVNSSIIPKWNSKFFKYLSNGVFQAEGHIGGYFISNKNNKFRPIIFIGLTADIESVKFFVFLNKELNNKMKYSIEKIASGKYYIKLQTRDWNIILNKVIPYFDHLYGDKYKGLKRLEKIYYLQSDDCNDINKNEKIILLAYHLIDNTQRKLSLSDRFSLFNISPTLTIDFFKILENIKELNFYFLLGFILGDGNISVRIRESVNLPWFIPRIRINQKITIDNSLLFDNISVLLKNENITSSKYINGHLIHLNIEGILNIEKLLKLFIQNSDCWFWKKRDYLTLKKTLLLMKLSASSWQKGKEILLNRLYLNFKYDKPLSYWQNIIISYYDKINKEKEYYISLHRDKAWAVKLPIKIKPKVKFFFFKTYDSKEKALIEAIKYREKKLKEWLKENELI